MEVFCCAYREGVKKKKSRRAGRRWNAAPNHDKQISRLDSEHTPSVETSVSATRTARIRVPCAPLM